MDRFCRKWPEMTGNNQKNLNFFQVFTVFWQKVWRIWPFWASFPKKKKNGPIFPENGRKTEGTPEGEPEGRKTGRRTGRGTNFDLLGPVFQEKKKKKKTDRVFPIRAFMKRFQRNLGVKLLLASLFEWCGLISEILIACLFVCFFFLRQSALVKIAILTFSSEIWVEAGNSSDWEW